jgi:hypothetical protein
MTWGPRGLEECTVDRWSKEKEYIGKYAPILSDLPTEIDKYRCSFSISCRIPESFPISGSEVRCRKIVGHYGDHKWFGSDKKGDYDIWMGSSKYDYQLEELI